MNVFITGSSRGLGLEFVRQYLIQGNTVIASCRNPAKAAALNSLQTDYPDNLSIIKLDVTKEEDRDRVFDELKQYTTFIDILINNAGIISGDEKNPSELGKIHKEDFGKVFLVNSIAPLLITEKFLPLLERSTEGKIVNISSLNGSIARRSVGGKYSYATSKAALNMITKILSNDLKEKDIITIALHPGWILTDMGGPEAPLEKEQPISDIINLISRLEITESGKFLDRHGNELEW